MPDKKLTDAEIVKAWESYKKDISCAKCGFEDKYLLTVLENTLDLINRLQAKVDFAENLNHLQMEEMQNLQAENERLKKVNLTLEKCCENCIHEEKTLQTHPCCECFGYRNFTPKDFLQQIKAEARKEFAERLKEKYGYFDWENKTIVYSEDEIDNLLKNWWVITNGKSIN